MPIGKDSITKRVAKQTEAAPAKTEEKIAPELVATTAVAPKPKKTAAKKADADANKKPASAAAKKTTSTAKKTTEKKDTAKKAPAKKSNANKSATPPAASEKTVASSAVLANVSPETVAAVIGHSEKEVGKTVQIGGKLPIHLL